MSNLQSLKRVIIADDHRLVRSGFVSIVNLIDNVAVVGEAANGKEVIDLLHRQPAHLVLMDIEMPVMGGLEATGVIRHEFPEVKVLIITMLQDADLIHRAVAVGANGMIYKNAKLEVLQIAIEKIVEGENYFDQQVSETLMASTKFEMKLPEDMKQLTPRELEIIKLVTKGYSSTTIGTQLTISSRTVDTHRTNILRKLNLSNTPALVRFAIENGLSG